MHVCRTPFLSSLETGSDSKSESKLASSAPGLAATGKRTPKTMDSKRIEKASAAVVATIPTGRNADKTLIADILLPELIRGIVELPPEDRVRGSALRDTQCHSSCDIVSRGVQRTQKARARHRTTKIKVRRQVEAGPPKLLTCISRCCNTKRIAT
jgi:hypothetical protein